LSKYRRCRPTPHPSRRCRQPGLQVPHPALDKLQQTFNNASYVLVIQSLRRGGPLLEAAQHHRLRWRKISFWDRSQGILQVVWGCLRHQFSK
jgi:hypothetical protein